MKLLAPLCLACLVATGCAHSIPYSYEQQCALKGMKLVGATQGTSSASAYNYNAGTTYIDANTETVQCAVPSGKEEQASVQNEQRVLTPIAEYNSNIKTKRLVTGIGYYFVILPGVIAKMIYDSKAEVAIEKSNQIRTELQSAPDSSIRVPAQK